MVSYVIFFFFSSRRRHTRCSRDWSSDVCSSDLPESFQIETQGNRVFVNCPDAGQVVESIERDTGKMTQWLIKGANGNYAMALNEPDQRLYTATRKRPYLIVFDTEGGREVARVPGIV